MLIHILSRPIAFKRVVPTTYPSILCLRAGSREPIAVRASCELVIGAFAALHESLIGPDPLSSPPANTAAIRGVSFRSPSLGQDFLLPEADRAVVGRAHDGQT
jgi:hypothetical protein